MLKNHLIDQQRKEQREWKHLNKLAVRQPEPLQPVLERVIDRVAQLGQDDLGTVGAWPLPQRLALLSLSGLWEKIPGPQWEAWVRDYQEQQDRSLPLPFPPETLRTASDIAGRNEVLAQALGVKRNTLAVWLYRYKDRLLECSPIFGPLEMVVYRTTDLV